LSKGDKLEDYLVPLWHPLFLKPLKGEPWISTGLQECHFAVADDKVHGKFSSIQSGINYLQLSHFRIVIPINPKKNLGLADVVESKPFVLNINGREIGRTAGLIEFECSEIKLELFTVTEDDEAYLIIDTLQQTTFDSYKNML